MRAWAPVRPLDVDVVGDIGSMLWVLLGTVGLVLLVACANVANLFLVRAEARQQELAIRLALGAETRRVVWELLVRVARCSRCWAACSASASPTAASGCWSTCSRRSCRGSTRSRIDPIVLLFTLGHHRWSPGLLFGVLPVLKYARPQLAAALKDSTRGSSDGKERHRARNTPGGGAGRVGAVSCWWPPD